MTSLPTQRERMPALPHNVVLLGWTSLVNDIASEMIVPLFPQFLIGVLGGTRWHLGLIEGIADTVSSLIKPWMGALSDRFKRRKTFVVAGYALAAAARPVMGLVVAPWQAIVVRVCDRLGKGVRTAPRDAMIADSADVSMRGRAFGFHRAMDHLGAAVGPLLAAALLWRWPDALRSLFLLTVIPGAIVVAVVAVGLVEPRAAPRSLESAEVEATVIAHGAFDARFRLYLTALFVFALGNSSDAFLLVRASELGVSLEMLPILWFGFHLVKSAGNLLAGRAADRLGYRPMIFIGWGIYAAVYVAFGLATATWHIWALFGVYGVFYAMTEPAEKALVARLVPEATRGRAYGWFNLVLGLAALPSSLAFGLVYERAGALAAFGMGAALAAAAAALLALVRTDE